jgi:hypothetical protein
MEKQGGQVHYHIHWSNSKFDWQPFDTLESARIEAERLALRGETFTIDQFDGDCAHCLRPPDGQNAKYFLNG